MLCIFFKNNNKKHEPNTNRNVTDGLIYNICGMWWCCRLKSNLNTNGGATDTHILFPLWKYYCSLLLLLYGCFFWGKIQIIVLTKKRLGSGGLEQINGVSIHFNGERWFEGFRVTHVVTEWIQLLYQGTTLASSFQLQVIPLVSNAHSQPSLPHPHELLEDSSGIPCSSIVTAIFKTGPLDDSDQGGKEGEKKNTPEFATAWQCPSRQGTVRCSGHCKQPRYQSWNISDNS